MSFLNVHENLEYITRKKKRNLGMENDCFYYYFRNEKNIKYALKNIIPNII